MTPSVFASVTVIGSIVVPIWHTYLLFILSFITCAFKISLDPFYMREHSFIYIVLSSAQEVQFLVSFYFPEP